MKIKEKTWLCTECGSHFTSDYKPKRSFFLGLTILRCNKCNKTIYYPCSKGYRIFLRTVFAGFLVMILFNSIIGVDSRGDVVYMNPISFRSITDNLLFVIFLVLVFIALRKDYILSQKVAKLSLSTKQP